MATKKKVTEKPEETLEVPKPVDEEAPKMIFVCNVNHDNKEYKTGDAWIGDVPECLKPFLK